MTLGCKFGRAIAGLVLLVSPLAAEDAALPLLTALGNTTISGYVDAGAHWNPGSGSSSLPSGVTYGTEVILQHKDGRLARWLLSGTQLIHSGPIVPASTIRGPHAAIASDKGSIFFEQAGSFSKGNSAIRISPALPMKDLSFAGAANVIGSSDSDLVWASKWNLLIWEMDGTRVTQQHVISGPFRVPINSKVVGIGHFDRNISSDFVWRDPQGVVWITLMEGRIVLGTVALNNGRPANLKWSLIGTGDFNFDRKTDLLWQHEDRRTATWLMDGTTRVSSKLLAGGKPTGVEWRIVDTETVLLSPFSIVNPLP